MVLSANWESERLEQDLHNIVCVRALMMRNLRYKDTLIGNLFD